ncbi:hypothetical protein [Dactylosporangium sp. CA-233914]|uniref:hypothetical protein n=1 Tax=Dactylosporangium sp. CA-233914 TaxID=3239934 RepID=UPI003D908E1C
MGVGQARNRLPRAVERTVPSGMLIQSLVIVWYAVPGHHPDDVDLRRQTQPWYDTKTEPSFEDMLTKPRKTLIAARFSTVRTGQTDPKYYVTTPWPAPQPPHRRETRADTERSFIDFSDAKTGRRNDATAADATEGQGVNDDRWNNASSQRNLPPSEAGQRITCQPHGIANVS